MLSISETLIKSQTSRKQTTGQWMHSKRDVDNQFVEVESYCAMGALFCEAEKAFHGTTTCSVDELLEIYGVVGDLCNKRFDCQDCLEHSEHDDDEEYKNMSLSAYIIHLNDTHEWTFADIGEEMRSQGF